MAKWRFWGFLVAITTLWFWIQSCYWHMGKASSDARHAETVRRSLGAAKKKATDDVMVLPPVVPRTTERIYEQRTRPPSARERKAQSKWKREKAPKSGNLPPPPRAAAKKPNKVVTTTTTFPPMRIDHHGPQLKDDHHDIFDQLVDKNPTPEEEAEFKEAAAALLREDQEAVHKGTLHKDEELMKTLATPESRLKKLVDRASKFPSSPYFKEFESAAKEGGPEGLVKELMDDPFPARFIHYGVDHSMARSVRGDLLDENHWIFHTMDNKLPPLPANSLCKFETGITYKDQGTYGHFEGLTDEGCCQKCIDAGIQCDVAEMSPMWAHPPRVCTLKVRIDGSQEASGVRACWKPGTSPNQFFEWRELGDRDKFD